jgi:acetyltransferase-like isoleucine patch superfamily enzyme
MRRLRALARARFALELAARKPVGRAERRKDRLVLGRGSYACDPDIVVDLGDPDHKVTVGNYTSIAEDVTFLIGGEHHPEWVSTFPFRIVYGLPGRCRDGQPNSRGPIAIGHDVWIGRGVTVRSGVTIGDGAVVGARSLVVKDIEPYTIVGGVPARVISKRFADRYIEALLTIRWWAWPEDEVVNIVDILCSDNVDALLAYAEKRIRDAQ